MTACVLRRFFVCSIALTVACGDSETTGAGGAGGAPTTSVQTTASTSDTASSTSTSTVSSSSSAGSTGGGGEGGEGGSGGAPPPNCDLDGDDFDRAGPGCCGAPDPCDCDDADPNVFPGQPTFFDEPRPNVAPNAPDAFDYNCDGTQEKQWPADNDGCGLLDCVAPVAFQGDGNEYFCGAPGTRIDCMLLSCSITGGVNLACR